MLTNITKELRGHSMFECTQFIELPTHWTPDTWWIMENAMYIEDVFTVIRSIETRALTGASS